VIHEIEEAKRMILEIVDYEEGRLTPLGVVERARSRGIECSVSSIAFRALRNTGQVVVDDDHLMVSKP
jgi:hypothetical protein